MRKLSEEERGLVMDALNCAVRGAEDMVRGQPAIEYMAEALKPALEIRKIQWMFTAAADIREADAENLRAVLEACRNLKENTGDMIEAPETVTLPLGWALDILTGDETARRKAVRCTETCRPPRSRRG